MNIEEEKKKNYELTLVPAYGRDYQSSEGVLKHWNEGKDFRIACVMSPWNGSYTSIRDLANFPGKHVKIRYNKLADFVLIDVATGEVQVNED